VEEGPLVFVGFGFFTGDLVEYARFAALDAKISVDAPLLRGVIVGGNPRPLRRRRLVATRSGIRR
jgi:hypothetical protein